MAGPFDKPIVCPVLVGREAHLAALLQCLGQAKAGLGQTVLVTGEGGIGKSRLVAEAKPHAELEGFLILQGNCFEPDRSLPYAPIVELLRIALASMPEDTIRRIVTVAPELRAMLPELAALLPDAGISSTLDAEQEKRRLFNVLTQTLSQLAERRPVLAIVEDMHWSDETSLEFLLYLTRRMAAQAVLLLLTYRSDEVHEDLARLLAAIDRERLAAEVHLGRLSRAEVGAMLRAIDEDRLDHAELVAAISELTEGNPFFVEEAVRSLSMAGEIGREDGGWSGNHLDELRIPRSIDDGVQRRVARVSPDARRVLTLAAVAGRRFEFPLLQALTGLDETAMLQLIKELIAAGLVVEEAAEQFAFRHALTRQAVYSGLLAQERRALHREIAETMERLAADTGEAHLADLAYHHYGAGHWAQALDFGRRAGEVARRLYAPRTAIEHFTRALEAAHRLTEPVAPSLYRRPAPLREQLPGDLYLERGRAYETIGNFERARADFETALELAELASDRRAEWQALMGLGLLWAERDYERTGDYYQRAVDLAQDIDDPALRARSLNSLGNWLANVGRPAESLRAHEQALALVKALGDERAIAETLDLLGMAYGLAEGDTIAASDHFARAAERFRALDDVPGLISSLTSYAVYTFPGNEEPLFSPLGQRDDCERTLDEALRLARHIEWLGGQAYAEFARGRALGSFGEFDAALAHARQSLAIATEIEHQQWASAAGCILGYIHVAMLAPDAAIPELETGCALAREIGSAWWTNWGTANLAFAHLLNGAPARAEAALAGVTPVNHRPLNVGERWVSWAWGELGLAKGRPDAALRIADALLDSAPGQGRGQPIPALLKLKGEALTALGRLDEAEPALAAAQRGAVGRGVRPLLWQVHRAQARLHRARKDFTAARRDCTAAREVIATLAATIGDDIERDRFERTTLNSLPTLPKGRPPSSRRIAAERFGGLTPREREVAAEIARGKSNRDIADSLFTAERTVASHVGHILAKLGFSSRAQIAVWARDKGLTDPE
jgi:DNA-binding CsgD family transcriptional regulator/tetratricopeptide (TPR) repeat protein